MNESSLVLAVAKADAESVRRRLRDVGLLDATRKIVKRDDTVLIPILSRPPSSLDIPGARVVGEIATPELRRARTPFESISDCFPLDRSLKARLPEKWERLGDVLIIKLPDELVPLGREVAEAYATVLGVKAVLRDAHGIEGDWRLPGVLKLWGGDTETVHLEDGVRFKMDPAKVMFSSGNLSERMRMARICEPGEVVVDMFAGIGYFSVPMAVHSRPERIFSCEVNPDAFHYLEENVRINRVQNIMPLFGDCRDVAPEGVADRVVMGYLKAQEYLDKAFRVIGDEGVIHYHETCPRELEVSRPWDTLRENASRAGRKVDLERFHRLKSYAPGVSHVVLDVRVSS